jgi:hypothetical protein
VPKYEPRAEAQPVRPAVSPPARKGERTVYFDGAIGIEATLYERDTLDVGTRIAGPAIIEQFDATTVIPPLWRVEVDGYRNLILTRAPVDRHGRASPRPSTSFVTGKQGADGRNKSGQDAALTQREA